MVARRRRGTTGADTPSVDLPGGTQSIQRAVGVLRILATARESGLGLTEIPLLALSRRTRDPLLDIVRPHLRAAVGEIGDTGFLTRRTGLDTVCVARQ